MKKPTKYQRWWMGKLETSATSYGYAFAPQLGTLPEYYQPRTRFIRQGSMEDAIANGWVEKTPLSNYSLTPAGRKALEG